MSHLCVCIMWSKFPPFTATMPAGVHAFITRCNAQFNNTIFIGDLIDSLTFIHLSKLCKLKESPSMKGLQKKTERKTFKIFWRSFK